MNRHLQVFILAVGFDLYWFMVVLFRERGLVLWLGLAILACFMLPAAQRLWQVEVSDLLVLRRTLLPADATAHRVAVLLERGTSAARICADLGWPPARLRSLLGRTPGRVTAVEALGVRALAESLDRVDQRSPVRDARAA